MFRLAINRISLPFAALVLGLGLALLLAAALGENPGWVLTVMLKGAFGSPTDFGYSLYYATPLLLTGASVAWAFRAGLFNVGAEGQMTMGGVALAAAGILAPNLPPVLALPLAFTAAFLAGGLWGALAGWMKAARGCHEVLTTILLNFVAYGLASFFILSVFKNPESQVPETAAVGPGYALAALPAWLGGQSPLNTGLLLALVMVLLYGWIMAQTRLGFHQRMAGGAPEVGRRAGLNMSRQTILAMFISGGLAGLAAVSPVLGLALKTREGFTANAGFVGIAVALLARNSAGGLVLAALLFGALFKGSLDLDLDTRFVSRDLALVIEALIVISVASRAGLAQAWRTWRAARA